MENVFWRLMPFRKFNIRLVNANILYETIFAFDTYKS